MRIGIDARPAPSREALPPSGTRGGLRAIFNATDRTDTGERLRRLVEKDRKSAPKLTEWIEAAVPEGLAVFELPEPHRCRLRATNALER